MYYYPNYEPALGRMLGPGCVNKWTLVTVGGNTFPMYITSYNFGGQVTGQIPIGLTNTSFPASSITDSTCL
ncbi:hypothetical protein ACLOF6_27770 [Bacillus sp. AF53]|uniref:hypothetical protein n=1 Tax=Bacillus sp. AF53 TaxID=3158958 RepID=UPI00398FF983